MYRVQQNILFVKAGLISPELVDILLVPVTPQTIKKPRKSAKVLTSEEVIKELEEKEKIKKEKEEETKNRAKQREEKKIKDS